MKTIRRITCNNGSGNVIIFGEKPDSEFIVTDVDGIYLMDTDLTVTNNTLSDGGVYQSTLIKPRNIVLTMRDRGKDDHVSKRQSLFSLFLPKQQGTLTFYESDSGSEEKREITYYVEKVESDGINSSREYTVSLICPDPYFYDTNNKVVNMETWEPAFTFPHAFTSAKEEFGYRLNEKIKNIINDTGAEATGLEITLTMSGSVTNPSVTRVESGEVLKIGSESKPLELVSGDQVIITTDANDKHVYLLREGVKTEINQYLTMDSVFITLSHGDNTIGYDADSGVDNISVVVKYRMRYVSC